MKTNYRICCLICSIFTSLSAFCQNLPEPALPKIIRTSPQSAQYTKYGEIPVGYTTGIPQIEIPLYTLEAGDFKLPVTLSYHASGFRPREISSPVGLGWILNAGGCITRNIDGLPDYKPGKTALYDSPAKSAAAFDSIKSGQKLVNNNDMSQSSSTQQWALAFTNPVPSYDLSSDRYSYHFLGYSGVGRFDMYSQSMILHTIPYVPLQFQYDPQGEKFTVTDTKGILYEFAEPDHTQQIGYPLLAVTGWYLTKITLPGLENEPIEFIYDTSTSYTQSFYTQVSRKMTYSFTSNSSIDGLTPQNLYTDVSASGGNYNSPLIRKITWRNVEIEFNYVSDRVDKMKERLTICTVKSGTTLIRRIEFDNNAYFGTTSTNKRLKLNAVRFTNSDEVYSFNYHSASAVLPSYDASNDYKCTEDAWGYWNGLSSNYYLPREVEAKWRNDFSPYTIPQTNRTPSVSHTKACVLTDLIYPTKGRTHFDYEQNQESKNNSFLGGLRVKRITHYSAEGTIAREKEYEYEGEALMDNTYSFEHYYHYTTLFMDKYTQTIGNLIFTHYLPYNVQCLTSTPFTSLSGLAPAPVFYFNVKEYEGTASSNNGWTVYAYGRNDTSYTLCYQDGPQMPRALILETDCDHGNIRGDLNSKTIYNADGQPVFRISHTYTHLSQMFSTGIRLTVAIETDGDWTDIADRKESDFATYILPNLLAYDKYGYSEFDLLSQTVNQYYENGIPSYQETIAYQYDYDENGYPLISRPTKIIQTNSSGKNHTQYTIYPYHTSYKNKATCSWMLTHHMLEYPVEEKLYAGTDTLQTVYTSYKTVSGNLLLPWKRSFSKGNGGTPEERIVYENYDKHGNLLYAVKDQIQKEVYVWSYMYSYPIIHVKGATYTEVKNAMGYSDSQIDALASQAIPSPTVILQLYNNIKTSLPTCNVSCYTYKPLVGPISETDTRGMTYRYDYDDAGRLINRWEDDGTRQCVTDHYEYHFSN